MKLLVCLAISILVMVGTTQLAVSQSINDWQGDVSNHETEWDKNNNWSQTAVPNNNYIARFGHYNPSHQPNLTGNGSAYEILFSSEATESFIISGSGYTLTIGSGGIVNDSSSTYEQTITVGNISLATGVTALNVQGIGNTTIQSIITSGNLIKSGNGRLTVSGANTYSGGTFIRSGSIQISGYDNRLPTGTTVTLGSDTSSGRLILGDASGPVNQTVAGLETSGSGVANAVVGASSGISTLTVNLNDNGAFGGTLGGGSGYENQLAFGIAGGTMLISGNNTYVGGTILSSGGKIVMGNAGAIGTYSVPGTASVSFSGGELDINDLGFTDGGTYSVSLGALSLMDNSTIHLRSGDDNTQTAITFNGIGTINTAMTLEITGWEGGARQSGTDDRLFLNGTYGQGDLDKLLGVIQFEGFPKGAVLLGNEISAVPEPNTILAACFLFGIFTWTERRQIGQLFRKTTKR